MIVTTLPLQGLALVELQAFRDERGFFMERYQRHKLAERGLDLSFVQENHSRSVPGVLRGLHYQSNPAQGKLVGVIRGSIWDVALDIRPQSPTFGQWYGVELSESNCRMLWIPAGFAHGFCVLGETPADVVYKTDQPYNPAGEGGIFYADGDLAIPWPATTPVVSARDRGLSTWRQFVAEVTRAHAA